MSPVQPIMPRQLRRLAEEAFGRTDEDMVLVYEERANSSRRRKAGWSLVPASESGGQFRVPINRGRTSDVPTDPPVWGTVTLTVQRWVEKNGNLVKVQKPFDLPTSCDALFWTPSAMEKFFLDYYRPLKEPAEWQALHDRIVNNRYDGVTVYAIAHTYPTVDDVIDDDPMAALADDPVNVLTEAGWEGGSSFVARLVAKHNLR